MFNSVDRGVKENSRRQLAKPIAFYKFLIIYILSYFSLPFLSIALTSQRHMETQFKRGVVYYDKMVFKGNIPFYEDAHFWFGLTQHMMHVLLYSLIIAHFVTPTLLCNKVYPAL